MQFGCRVSERSTSQGLCGVVSSDGVAVVAELNCETDFVASNLEFKKLVL